MKASSLLVPLGALDFFSIGFKLVPNPLWSGGNDDGGGDILVGGVAHDNDVVLVLCVETELLE
jgi:hypothetical protein